MSDRLVNAFGAIAILGLFIGGCAGGEMMGSPTPESTSGSGVTSTSTRNIDRIASGAAEDSLAACLGRIPKDASAGQKMLAEESCKRDQANRR